VVVLRYRLSLGIVLLAVSATACVFTFARPEYRGPGSTFHDVKPLSYVSPASNGWTWPHGTPGFRIGHDEDRWNMSLIHWRDLSTLRYAARAAHVDPQSLRVIDAARLMPGPRERPFLLVGGRGTNGRTCIGAQPGDATPSFFCGSRLRDQYAVVLASPRPAFAAGDRAIFVEGVVSGAVQKVTITTVGATDTTVQGTHRTVRPEGPVTMYDRATFDHTWGTFISYRGQPVPWSARIDFYGAHGKLASLPLRFTKPGAYLYCASAMPASCGS
jgi:hypothetical protein